MQAAEAYAAKNRAAAKNGNGTWSGSKNSLTSGRGRQSRPALTSDTFRPPSRTSSRPVSRYEFSRQIRDKHEFLSEFYSKNLNFRAKNAVKYLNFRAIFLLMFEFSRQKSEEIFEFPR